MLIGFGCSVPAVMATRTLSSERDRKMTILLLPFMSCSAKIPVYAVFAAAFFTRYRALVMIGLYISGIITGIFCSLVLRKTAYKGNPVPFVMELPNYRIPSIKSVVLLMWVKAKDFLQRAFTVIFIASIIIWFLQTFDTKLNVVYGSEHSLLALIGKVIAPVFKPLGFNNWKISTSLIAGLSAKEAVVSTLSVLTATTAAGLSTTLSQLFTPLSALSFLVFTLLYTPCLAAVAAIKRELNSWLKTIVIVIAQCGVAWLAAFALFQIVSLFI
jgi:ferrous iron transport protein B